MYLNLKLSQLNVISTDIHFILQWKSVWKALSFQGIYNFVVLKNPVFSRDHAGQVPYNCAQTKDVRNEFRNFMGKHPELYDYKKAQVNSRKYSVYHFDAIYKNETWNNKVGHYELNNKDFLLHRKGWNILYCSPGDCWSSSHWRSAYVDVKCSLF